MSWWPKALIHHWQPTHPCVLTLCASIHRVSRHRISVGLIIDLDVGPCFLSSRRCYGKRDFPALKSRPAVSDLGELEHALTSLYVE